MKKCMELVWNLLNEMFKNGPIALKQAKYAISKG